jgi:hypothetical protein
MDKRVGLLLLGSRQLHTWRAVEHEDPPARLYRYLYVKLIDASRSTMVSNVRRPLALGWLIPVLKLLSSQKRQFYLHNRGFGGPNASEPRVIKRLALSHGLSELNLLIGLDGRSSLRPVR